jgi:hypothetical protein
VGVYGETRKRENLFVGGGNGLLRKKTMKR